MKPKFIVTVDTETFRVGGRLLPFEALLYGNLPQGCFGVQKIMDLCDQHGAKATFFVDVYMHHAYGEANVAELCQRIDRAGHDVQLHAHPSWLPRDPSALICDFPRDRQTEILASGKQLVEKWIGKSPVGFRAGAYGANLNTLRALKDNGFRVDSSYLPLNRNCELSRELNGRCTNQPFFVEGLLEIPVTTYWLWNSSSRRKNSKIDVNACSWPELSRVLRQLTSSSLQYVVLFAHSFSFLQWDGEGGSLAPKYGPLKRFEALLRMIRQDLRGEFSTIAETAQAVAAEPSSADFVPSVSLLELVQRVVTRVLERR
jgi:peptidoglycan/xylan/chitin deacetylase (PgdA/CDA1 family)